jgi:mRNA-degrading endonuclease RelE of RelBE toxin-antitoxin system
MHDLFFYEAGTQPLSHINDVAEELSHVSIQDEIDREYIKDIIEEKQKFHEDWVQAHCLLDVQFLQTGRSDDGYRFIFTMDEELSPIKLIIATDHDGQYKLAEYFDRMPSDEEQHVITTILADPDTAYENIAPEEAIDIILEHL